MGRTTAAALFLIYVVAGAASCSAGGSGAHSSAPPPAISQGPSLSTSPATPSASPVYPAFWIEALRQQQYPGGRLAVGDLMVQAAGFTKYHMSWPSGGETMTGTISIPDGPGPFPVVVVNHGYIPASRYWIGQDSGIFGDPLAAHGFISVAPNYPGYAGSGPGRKDMPAIVATAVTVLDLVSSLRTLPQADSSRMGMIGHSNGGGVSLLVMAIDPQVRVFALYAPVSSDMSENARKWWLANGSQGPLGSPDADPQAYAHISPRNYLDRTKAPVLFLQGSEDEDIPAAWTNATVAALQQKGIATRTVWLPGAHHDLVGADLAAANAAAEAWIRASLSG